VTANTNVAAANRSETSGGASILASLRRTSRSSIGMVWVKLLFPLCLGVILCPAQRRGSTSQQSIPSDTLIKLRRPNCFLGCEDYLVTISADGSVTFEGYANVKVIGRVQTQISPKKVEMLVAAFLKAKFFSLRDEYVWQEDGCRKVWPDASSATTSILINGKSKSVDHYHGCHRKGHTPYPEDLTKLEEMIDEVANTYRWINGPPATTNQ